jgi:transposase
MQADLNAAINILARLDDKELHRWLPFTKVKQILLERYRRSDETAHPELQLQLI